MSKPDASERCLSCGSSAFQVSTIDGRRMCRICPASWPAPTEKPAEACGNCRNARRGAHQGVDLRECRRHAPRSPHWWPSVRVDSWCGEYQRGEA